MKKCGKCGVAKSLSEYHKNPTKKQGVQNVCKECRKEYIRAHYKKNKDRYLIGNKQREARNRLFITRYKKINQCAICGDKRWYVLDFHHNRDKEGVVSLMVHRGVSIDSLKKEIRKCDLLCANCHRELHYNMRQ